MALDKPSQGDDSRKNWKFIAKQAAAIDEINAALFFDGSKQKRRRNPLGGGGWRFASPREFDREQSYGENEVVVVSPDNESILEGATLADSETHGVLLGVDGTPSETSGPDSEDTPTAGVWVALQPTHVLSAVQPEDPEAPRNYDVHLPTWPPPSFVPGVPADPEADPPTEATEDEWNMLVEVEGVLVNNPLNFWELIGFRPIKRQWCDEDGPHEYYVQAVKIPDPIEE